MLFIGIFLLKHMFYRKTGYKVVVEHLSVICMPSYGVCVRIKGKLFKSVQKRDFSTKELQER